jgi:ribosomal protein S20
LAHSSRTWRGARTPQAMKRVRQDVRKQAVNRPHRSRTKTLVIKAIAAAQTGEAAETQTALVAAVSALDRAAKAGAIHPNAAARRKSRLMLKINAALGGEAIVGAAKAGRSTGKAAAAKAAKARVAASKAAKAKGEQTAAGKARAALSRSTRGDGAQEPTASATATPAPVAAAPAGRKPAAKPAAKAKAPAKPTKTKAPAKPKTK